MPTLNKSLVTIRRFFATLLFIVFATVSPIAMADTIVPLNDYLTLDSFPLAFSQTCDNNGYSFPLKCLEYNKTFSPQDHGTVYQVHNNNGNRNLIFVFSDADKRITALQLSIVLNPNDNTEHALKILISEALLAQRTLGAPDGYETINATIATSDALRLGHGEYWSNHTNRRYVIVSEKKQNIIRIKIIALR